MFHQADLAGDVAIHHGASTACYNALLVGKVMAVLAP